MVEVFNPYRPGAGTQPPELVGRQAQIDRVDLMVAHARAGRNDGGLFLYGLRGVGKTVLLQRLREIGDRAGWLTVTIEARPGEAGAAFARQRLGRGLVAAVRKMQLFKHAAAEVRNALQSASAFTLSVAGVSLGATIEPSPYRANSGNLEIDLEELIDDLSPALRKNTSALAFFVDELQDLDETLLIALLAAQHKAMQENLPFYLIGAGLPTLVGALADARSYTERFEVRPIGPLAKHEAHSALVDPAQRLGMTIEDDAAAVMLDAARGYPYFLQAYGHAMWDLVAGGRRVTRTEAEIAVANGNNTLDQGFFIARWDRTTPGEQQYLRTIAELGGQEAGTSDIAAHLGKQPKAFGPVRDSLIKKGIIYPSERGVVAFTVPNMDDFIRRHNVEADPR